MKRIVLALVIAMSFGVAACAVEQGDSEQETAPTEETLVEEGMMLEVHTEVKVSRKDDAPPSTNMSCGGYSEWSRVNNNTWCGGTGLGCLFENRVGKYTREHRHRKCCDAQAVCWVEFEYRDALLQCGC